MFSRYASQSRTTWTSVNLPDRKASVASSLSVLTVLARLFDLFQVGGLEHGADLLRGVDDDAAEGVEAVHQADVDPRQGNVGGFFLPL